MLLKSSHNSKRNQKLIGHNILLNSIMGKHIRRIMILTIVFTMKIHDYMYDQRTLHPKLRIKVRTFV
jgi:hypothetical protein